MPVVEVAAYACFKTNEVVSLLLILMKCALTSQPFVNNEAAWAQSARVLRKKDMYTCFFSYIFLYTLQQEEVGEKS
jgi:hypothetical protein